MLRPDRRRLKRFALRVLAGVGIESRQEIEFTRACCMVLRAATDEEVGLADMSRFPEEGTTK